MSGNEDIRNKCIGDLRREYAELVEQRDALKAAAKEALFVLEREGIEHELQERLQLAICDLPKPKKEADNGKKD